jgi:hypothetical protein
MEILGLLARFFPCPTIMHKGFCIAQGHARYLNYSPNTLDPSESITLKVHRNIFERPPLLPTATGIRNHPIVYL